MNKSQSKNNDFVAPEQVVSDQRSLCPKCGQFAMSFVKGYAPDGDCYLCSCCGHRISGDGARFSLNENNMQRFPGKEQPGCPLEDFVRKKGR